MLYRGDCLEIMPTLAAGSVDMVMCDLPYGTTACKWDSVIPFDTLWSNYRQLCTGAVVLTASQPFTTALIASNMREFKYCWVWDKKAAGNAGLAKYQPLKTHEDVVVFSAPTARTKYFPVMTRGKMRMKGGKAASGGAQSGRLSGYQYESDEYYPKSIIEFTNAGRVGRVHPTQKPVALMEYLIRTYTNEGGTVLDNCMGSGTTGVACMQSGRNFIGIELNDYAQAAALRILKAWGGDTMRTIFATPYNDETKQPTSPSADSGFTTIGEVVEAMGPDWLSCSGRAVVYPGVMFSDYEVSI